MHNSVQNSKKAICNIMKAKPKFIMTNTYNPYFMRITGICGEDLSTGAHYYIGLFGFPFYFPLPLEAF